MSKQIRKKTNPYPSPYLQNGIKNSRYEISEIHPRKHFTIQKGLWSAVSGGEGHLWKFGSIKSNGFRRVKLDLALCQFCEKPKFLVEFKKCRGRSHA